MAGLGYIVGGALSGLGAGMVKQAEMDWNQRRELALQNARGVRERENIQMEGDQARETAKTQSNLRDQEAKAAEEREVERKKNIKPISKVKTTIQDAEGFYHNLFEDGTVVKTAVRGPKPKPNETFSQIVQAEDGTYQVVMSDGTMKKTDIKGPRKAQPGGGADAPLQKAGGGAGVKPATPGAKVTISGW